MKPFRISTSWRLVLRAFLSLVILTLSSAAVNAQSISLGEAVDNTSLTWTTGGDADWFGQTSVYYYGGSAAQSGNVSGGHTSWIQTTVTGPGILSFHWNDSDIFDTLTFSMDGVNKATYYFFHDWELQVLPIPSGSHTLQWVYLANASGQAAYLDKVVFTTGSGPTLGEAVDNTSLAWATGGDTGWFGETEISYYGGNAARSGNIAPGQSSWIQTIVTGPGVLSFYWKVSSFFEMQYLKFSLDGVNKSSCWAGGAYGDLWEPQIYPIPSGSHTLRWSYSALNPGGAGYLDKVVFAAGPGPTLGEAVDNTSLTWATGGDAGWFGQTEISSYGGSAAHSGNVVQGQSSWVQTTVTGPGILSFYWKMVTPFMAPDFTFSIDGGRQSQLAYGGWVHGVFPISSGSHTLRWVFAPASGAPGSAFLDKVVYISGPAIMVLTPNGGETWYSRNFNAITWVSSEDVGPRIRIELYKGGSLHSTIAASTDNDRSYAWFVPLAVTPGTDYQIKIISASSPSVYDYSDGNVSFSQSVLASFAGALILDGVDDYAEAAAHSDLDVGGGSFTLEAWVNFQGFNGVQLANIIAESGSYGLKAQEWYDGSHILRCLWFDSGSGSSFSRCRWPSYENGWHPVAAVFNQGTGQMQLYLDGATFGEPINPGPIQNSTGSLRVGEKLHGAVDEVRISDIARYSDSTYEFSLSPLPCDANTRALWHFNEIAGAASFHDVCGVDNVLQGHNGAHTEGMSGYWLYLPLTIK